MTPSQFLNTVGILVEILAAAMLFSKITTIKKLESLDRRRMWINSNVDIMDDLVDQINDRFRVFNETNRESSKIAIWWIGIAVTGLVIQLSASFF